MSDLKHKTLPELLKAKRFCERYIKSLRSKLSGQQVRLHWIDTYISQKRAKEMSIDHKYIIEIAVVKTDLTVNQGLAVSEAILDIKDVYNVEVDAHSGLIVSLKLDTQNVLDVAMIAQNIKVKIRGIINEILKTNVS